MLVAVQLRNSDGSAIATFLPSYSIDSGAGVVSGPCSFSNASGISTCSLQSTVPGTKVFQLNNANRAIASLVFSAPMGSQGGLVVAGALAQGKTSDGYTVNVSVGGPAQHFNSLTADGYALKYSTYGMGAR
jgi:hypothetical protein